MSNVRPHLFEMPIWPSLRARGRTARLATVASELDVSLAATPTSATSPSQPANAPAGPVTIISHLVGDDLGPRPCGGRLRYDRTGKGSRTSHDVRRGGALVTIPIRRQIPSMSC